MLAASTRIVTATVLVTAGATLPLFLVGATAVQIQEDLGFGQTGLGIVVASFTCSVTLSAWLLGKLADRISGQAAMRLGVAFTGATALTIGAIGPRLSLITLALLLAAAGLGNALAQPASGALLFQRVSNKRLGLAFGTFQSAKPLAVILSGLSVPIIAVSVGWRWAFVAAGVFALVTTITVPRSELSLTGTPTRDDVGTVLSRSLLLLLVLGLAFGFGTADMISTFLVVSAVDQGITLSSAALLLSIGAVTSILARLYLGHRADSSPIAPLRTIRTMLVIGSFAAFAIAVGDDPFIFVIAAVVASFTVGGIPGLIFLSLVRLHSRAPGVIAGIGLSAGSFGGIAGPISFGLVAENFSIRAAWLFCSVWALIAASLMHLAARRVVLSKTDPSSGWTPHAAITGATSPHKNSYEATVTFEDRDRPDPITSHGGGTSDTPYIHNEETP